MMPRRSRRSAHLDHQGPGILAALTLRCAVRLAARGLPATPRDAAAHAIAILLRRAGTSATPRAILRRKGPL